MNEFAPAPVKPPVQFAVLEALDPRVGTIVRVEEVPHSEKPVRPTMDFGDRTRRTLAGIRKERENPREIEGRQALLVVNREARKMAGGMSDRSCWPWAMRTGLQRRWPCRSARCPMARARVNGAGQIGPTVEESGVSRDKEDRLIPPGYTGSRGCLCLLRASTAPEMDVTHCSTKT